jgi:hypothetical protein
MAANIVSTVMQYITPDTVGRISTALGLDRGKTQSAVGAAVPGLLASFSGLASRPDGAERLADAARQQSGVLDNISGMFGSNGQSGLIDKGSQLLSSLLGSGNSSALANAVGSFSGIGRGAGTSLLGMAVPFVLGALAKHGGRDIDGAGLASMFAGQRDNIASALPSGFRKMLGGTDLLHSIDTGRTTTESTRTVGDTPRAAAAASYAARDPGRRVQSAGTTHSPSRWLYWAIPALALAAIALYMLSRPDTDRNVRVAATNTEQALVVDGVNIGNQINSAMNGFRTTLTGITDAASAERAVPQLQQIGSQLDQIAGLKGQLSASQRTTLNGMIAPAMTAIRDQSNRTLAIPGVADVIKPTVDSVMSKLTALMS